MTFSSVLLLAAAPAFVVPAGAETMSSARLLVEAQRQAADAVVTVLASANLDPEERAARLLPLVDQLERLNAQRSQTPPDELEQEEARAAQDPFVQQLALQLYDLIHRAAAADYDGSPALRDAVKRLYACLEGENK